MHIFSGSPENSNHQPSNLSIKWVDQEKWYQQRIKALQKKVPVVETIDLTINDSIAEDHKNGDDDDDDVNYSTMGLPKANSTAQHHDI